MSNFLNQISCAKALINWSLGNGYQRQDIKNEIGLTEDDWYEVTACSMPSGSSWQKYLGFRSIRVWEFQSRNELFVIFSISTFVEVNDLTGKSVPRTEIWILRHSTLKELCNKKQELYEFLNLDKIEKTAGPREDIISKIDRNSCIIVLQLELQISKNSAWPYLELIMLDMFFQTLPSKFVSFSTLCTMQDDTKIFNLKSYLDILPQERMAVSKVTINSDFEYSIEVKQSKNILLYTLETWLSREFKIRNYLLFILLQVTFFLGLVMGWFAQRSR